MQDIELKALQCYERNLEYFSKSHQKLLKKIQVFDIPETQKKFIPHYDLEYKENYFDVKEIATGNYLYATNSIEYSNKIADSINFKKDSNTFSGLKDYILTASQLKQVKKRSTLKGTTLKDILPIMNYSLQLAPNTSTMKKIDKFIFIGVALGLHITDINKRINSEEYLIIEDNLELFRLSLFTTEYYKLAINANLHFAIAEDETSFTFTMVNFLEGSFFNNRYIKYFHLATHSTSKIKLIQNNLASQNHITFPYDIQLEKTIRPLKRIKNNYKTIDFSKKFPESIISQKPLLILAAGPSFLKNLDFLKKNHTKFIIIAVTAVLKTLNNYNIKPDIVTHIDGIETEGNSCMIHFDGFNVTKFLEDTILIFGTHTPDSLLNMFNKKNIFFFEGATYYFNNFGTLSTPCIGSTSAILSLWLNAKNIYLLGLDLALDQETGATHSVDHLYNETYDLGNLTEIDYTISLRENIIPVKGNFRKTVYSTPIFLVSIRSLYGNIKFIKDSSQTIYNLNDGAYLQNTQSQNISDINVETLNTINKKELYYTLYTVINDKARNYLNDSEKESLKKRLINANTILKQLKQYEKQKSKRFINEVSYLYDLLGIVSSILKVKGREGDNISAIYSSYFQYTLPYIIDIINTKEIIKTMYHLQKIDAMFINGCRRIIKVYIQGIEEFFTTP